MGLRVGYWERRRLAEMYRRGEVRPPVGYFAGVRHPLPSLFLIVILLAIYEAGVSHFTSPDGQSTRAGIELWLRDWLSMAVPVPPLVIPAALVGLILIWTLWKWLDRPDGFVFTFFGMCVEGVLYGVLLWFGCLYAPMLLEQNGLSLGAINGLDPRLITFVGVGIYEEAVFRLILFAWLARLLNIVFVPWVIALPVAMAVSAVAFALAHHLVQSDSFVPIVFVTRTLIGVYLAVVFWARGMGVAVGAHIVYDIMVAWSHD
jgi:membrane protease YdiL (CAAX protease family)